MKIKAGELDTKQRDALSDSDYAYIDSKGNRKLPINDADHVRAALARFSQTQFESDDDKAAAWKKILAAAKKFDIEVSDKTMANEGRKMHGMIQIVDRPKKADDTAVTYGDDGIAQTIEIMKVGEWRYAFGEPVVIEPADLDLMVSNFKAGVRKGIALDCDHDMGASTGWVSSLSTGADSNGVYTLYATIEWTPLGQELLSGKIYKFFSPEWYTTYEDPESGEVYEQVLTGGALTNRPLMKSLAPLVASEQGLTANSDGFTLYLEDSQIKNNTKRKVASMDLDTVRQKGSADECTPEEMSLLKSHVADLTSDELDKFGLTYPPAEDDGEGEDEAVGDSSAENMANEKTNNSKKMKKADEVKNGEEITVSKTELDALRRQANEGSEALKKLQASEAREKINGFIASESNQGGKFSPSIKDALVAFYLGLTSKQASEFEALVEQLPALKVFNEIGSSEEPAEGAGVENQINVKATELMKANDKLTFSEAVKQVMASESGLSKTYRESVEK